jgi:sugar phosphate isomerase/epimerase
MKIGTESMIFREKTDERRCLELIAGAGFDCVDYSMFNLAGKSPDWLLADDYLSRAAETKKMLAEVGLECYQGHAPFRLTWDGARDESNPDYLGILRALEYAGIIGCSRVVVHGIGQSRDVDIVKFNQEFYLSLEPYARKAGVKIAVENLFRHDEFHPHLLKRIDAAELTGILSGLPSDCFTGCLDVGHAAICGTEPDEFLRSIPKGLITCLHVQDNDRTKDLHLLPYISQLRMAEFLAALKEYGYDGVFNLETSHFYRNIPVELLPAALRFAAETARYMVRQLESLEA